MQNRPHILIITGHWEERTCAGIATSCRRVATHLAKAGLPVTVFTFNLGRPLEKPESEPGGEFEVVRFGPHFSGSPEEFSRMDLTLRRRQIFDDMEIESRRRSVNGILSFFIAEAGWLATYLSNSLGVPHVLGVRGSDVCIHMFAASQLPIIRMAAENAAAIICVNQYVRQRLLIAAPAASAKAKIILNGTDVGDAPLARDEIRRMIEARTSWPSQSPWAAFIGIPREKKGISYLLDALLRLPREHPLKFLCIGPEPEPKEMKTIAGAWQQLKDEQRLYCSGIRPRSEALRLAAGADIIVMPSVQDGLANGLLEGMALGLCPVVSDIFSDVLSDRETAMIAPRGDAVALAQALDRAASNPDQRRAIGTAARQLVMTRHSPEREAQDYIDCFKKAGIE